jgi:hypothetical protein
MRDDDEDRRGEVHPVPWVGEGTVPDVVRREEPRQGGLLRFAAGTAAVALAVGVGGGLAVRSWVQHESGPGVTTSTADPAAGAQPPAPAPAPTLVPAPAHHEVEHEDSD